MKSIVRGAADVGVAYTYDDAGRLVLVEHTDGVNVASKVVRQYDDADRLVWIEHRTAADVVLLRIEYVWNPDNTVDP